MKKRYVIYLLLIVLVLQSIIPVITPVRPVITLPGEIFAARGMPVLGGITNTFLASVLAYVLLLVVTLRLRAGSRSAEEVPTGFYNFFEMLIEMAYNYVENQVGKWAKVFFPFFMTFILFIVSANWMGLIPGFDSVGKWETMGELFEHKAEAEAKAEGIKLTEDEKHHIYDEAMEANVGDLRRGLFLMKATTETNAVGEQVKPEDADYTIVPFLRPAATDLSFTLALAIISLVMTQYYGMKAKGMGYWGKFFVWNGDKIAKSPLAVIDSGVGLLELVSEIFKVVSFAFRLLGNIFAGMVLLFVIGSLLPIANLLFYHLEFGIGLLQGVVFALLTLTFMKSAVEEAHH